MGKRAGEMTRLFLKAEICGKGGRRFHAAARLRSTTPTCVHSCSPSPHSYLKTHAKELGCARSPGRWNNTNRKGSYDLGILI